MNLREIKKQSYSICMTAVEIDPKAILYMHVDYEDVYIHAVKQRGKLLKDIEQQTNSICLAAVRNNGWTALSILDTRQPHFTAASKASGLIPSRCE